MRNIDDDINKLLGIRRCILEIKRYTKQYKLDLIPISKCKYDEIVLNSAIRNDAFYYILDPEIGQYLEGYIC